MRLGVGLAPYSQVEDLSRMARRVEGAGADFVWVSDHHRYRYVYSVLTRLACVTERVKIGPGVTNPYLSHPSVIASAMATLDEISNGRATLGISSGDPYSLAAMGVEQRRPVTAVREAVQIIRGLLSGERVDYSGEVFSCRGARLNFKPPGEVSVYIGGRGRRMLGLAGEVADGALINAAHPGDVKECVEYVRAGARKSKRELKDLDVVVYAATSIDDDEERAREGVRTVAALISASAPERSLERHGISREDVERVREILRTGDVQKARDVVTDAMIDAFTICGPIDELLSRAEEFRKLGVTQIVMSSPIGPDPSKVIGSIREELV